MNQVSEFMTQLLKSEIAEEELCCEKKIALTDKFLIDLLVLSRKHQVAHIVASALSNNGYLEKSPQKGEFLNEIYTAVYAQEKMNEVFEEISSAFQLNEIPYIPLKGLVIRGLYPQPWMRTSCDIDILVKEKDINRAEKVIMSLGGYKKTGESKHDVIFKSENGIVLELHYKLLGNKKSPLYVKELSKVWEMAEPDPVNKFRFNLSDDIFYYYHIMHMAKHFRIGGCGIRPFIDLWLIEKTNRDFSGAKRMLEKGNIDIFADNAVKLSRVWFSNEKHSGTTAKMQDFIIEAGSFGSHKTRLIANSQRSGGKLKFIFSRVFVPYSYLKRDYPILEKCPILTPWCEICRLFSFLFGKKKIFKDKYIENLNKEANAPTDSMENLFYDLGLK